MSQPHEPSYYEIALTNRQVLTVFVVLLVCVVAAFFSGVWIGRRGAGPQAPELVAEVAPPDEAAEASGEPVKELRFFSDEPRRPGKEGRRPQAPASPSPDTTLREDLGAGAGRPPIESPAAGAEGDEADPAPGGKAPAAAPEPAPAAGSPQPDKVASKPPAAPQPEKVAAKPPAAPAAGSGAAAAGAGQTTGDLVIQVFFSSDEEKARALVERLGGSGYPAFLSPVRVGMQTMYRVRVGPYRERAEAEAIASKVQRAFKLDTWITQ